MADKYVKALEQIEKSMKDTLISMQGDKTRFHSFVTDISGEKMSDNDYLRVLEIFYGLYQRKNESKAQMYCILRMMQLELARRKPYLQSMYPHIQFTKDTDSRIESFVSRKRPFYQVISDRYERRFDLGSTLLCMALLALLVLAVHLPFLLSFIACFLLWFLLIRIGSRWYAPMMTQEQINALITKLEPVHQEFEKQMGFRAPDFTLV